MTVVQRSLRLTGQSVTSLDANTHNNGEIFFDSTNKTFRIFDGKVRGGTVVATRPWVASTVGALVEANQKKTSFSPTPPSNPIAGESWVNITNGNMYVYYNDGNSSQWIQPVKNNLSISTSGLGSFSSGTGVSQSYVDTSINTVLGAPPSNLNSLGKLAAAVNNDPNFSATVLSSLAMLAPAASPVFSGTVSGITASMVGLGNVTNESKATMFHNPAFTGTVTGISISAEVVGLGNVVNESKAVMFNNPHFTGTVTGVTKAMVGLNNATNESKATMFTSPTFTGTVNGVTKAHVGLGNVVNESKATMFSSPTFTGTVSGITATMVGLGNVVNESKATMFSSPTFTGTVSGVTATHVGLGNVTNESKATMFSSPTFTGTVSGVTATHVGLGNVTNESKATMFSSPTFTGTVSGISATMVGLDSKAEMFTNPTFTGLMTSQQSTELFAVKTGATGTVVHDFSTGAIWSHESIAANFTANFTNMPTITGRTIVCTLMLLQGSTAYIPSAVQIDGVAQALNWQGGSAPTGGANKKEIVSFTFIRSAIGPAWFVLGSLSSYG